MKITLCQCKDECCQHKPHALIRRVEDALPQSIEAVWKEPFQKDQEKDAAGCRVLRTVVDGEIQELVVLTMDKDAKTRAWQKGLNKLYGKISDLEIEDANLLLIGSYQDCEQVQIVKTLLLATYSFDQFKGSGYSNKLEKEEDKSYKAGNWTICGEFSDTEKILEEGEILAESIAHARDLVNLPANHLTPTILAEKAQEYAKEYGFEIEVFGPKEIQEKGLEAYWSVAKGSDEEPRFIIMRYHNNPESKEILGLVGKGLTYDSGGYDIKPGPGMVTMQSDMGGSAGTIGAICALARAKAKVNVTAIVAACENMVSGHAFRNGDIIGSLAGKSIDIVSTDAEGRLTLADAVCYAWKEEKVTAIIEMATLTGACGVALGDKTTAVLADSEKLFEAATVASEISGDKIWRLPIDDEFEELNKSKRADIKNSGGRMGGTITAGLFVRAFANEIPFMHWDIAYTAWYSSADERDPEGGTGVGCELAYHSINKFFE